MDNQLNKKRLPVREVAVLIPAFVFTLSILIARTHVGYQPMSQFFWFGGNNENQLVDTYCYYKQIAVCAAAFLAVCAVVFRYFKYDFKFKKSFVYIPCAVYLLFVLLSFVFSDYKYFALRGMNDHFQGIFALLSYMVMIVFILNNADSEIGVKAIVFTALFAAAVLGCLGITQATGHDFFQTVIGQKLITPNTDMGNGLTAWQMIDLLSATGQQAYEYRFTAGQVYQTVFNINYVPFYLTLLVPLAAMLCVRFMAVEKKNYLLGILCCGLFGLFLYNFFAANSASGYFGLAAIVLGGLIVFNKRIIKWIKPLLCLVLVAALVMGLLVDRWLPEVKSKFTEGSRLILNLTADTAYAGNMPEHFSTDFTNAPGSIKPVIDYISTEEGKLVFSINGDPIVVTRNSEEKRYDIVDGSGEQILLGTKKDAPGIYELLDTRFHDYVYMQMGESDGFTYIIFNTPSREWQFRYTGEEFLYRTPVGGETGLKKVEVSSLIEDMRFGSWRGGIWNTTVPLLKENLLWGFGPDCFTIAYPQGNYAGMYSTGWDIEGTLVVDKAHNMYLQIWVETGLIALLAWIGIALTYLIGAIKYFRKRGLADTVDFINGGIFLGILGFLATGFFNDGSVNTWPMYFTMLGTGLAINARDSWPDPKAEAASSEPAVDASGEDEAMPVM